MAFAAARMILKDKRRKPSREEYVPRNRSKARNKPADGSTLVSQKLQAGQRTPTKNVSGKQTGKPAGKPAVAQKGQPIKQAPAKVAAAAAVKTTKKTKKGKHHQHDLIVTIDLVKKYF